MAVRALMELTLLPTRFLTGGSGRSVVPRCFPIRTEGLWHRDRADLERIVVFDWFLVGNRTVANGAAIDREVVNDVTLGAMSESLLARCRNASSLTELSIGNNKFEGSIPVQIGRLSKLKLLQLGGNHLSGPIPTPIYNLSSLLYLDVSENHLTGRIHPDIGRTLSNLLGLYVSLNHFMGPIPVSLSNASGLKYLSIGANSFTGTVPTNPGSLRALERLSLSENQLGIMEPDGLSFLNSLPNCSRFQMLDIGKNRFKGKLTDSVSNLSTALQYLLAGNIPEAIEKLVGLQFLVMSWNSITGEMPAGIGKLKQLMDLHLFDNKISGVIPSSIGNLTQLRQLKLHTNNLGGNIPSSLGNSEQLELLRLFNNNLTGVIPREVASLSSITLSFNLAQNSLTGPFPSEVGNMSHLLDFDISLNRLSGEIPSTISNCLMLEQLHMGSNLLQGPIPSAFSTLKSLQVLDHSRNNFSGEIPVYLQNLIFLQNLNLSFNNLKGEVPREGVFRNASEFSIVELSKATNQFSPSNLIGEGSYGSVYRGILHTDGMIVAVKVLNLKQKGAAKCFMAECNALQNMSHRNLVKIITTCSSIDSRGRRPTDSIFTDGMNIHQFAKMAIPEGVPEIVDPSLLSKARDEDNNDPNVGRSKRSTSAEECLSALLKIGVSSSMESAEERMGIRDAQAELHIW
ncbi:hypothetical protein RJ639_023255 [Escallonia herrerae]|uniref:non-specific serine/threonine protein kinase n=1 Tax=Escallonia herrerae TaxID=1293975 RepID=A0AA88UZC8_9ASTE|nr:hypothetical protein RJ639_023255 [Escallonia herrerae]